MDYTVWQESHMLIECLLNYFRSVAFDRWKHSVPWKLLRIDTVDCNF